MASITLNRVQVTNLLDFCKKHGKKNFFIAKDQGAYVGQSVGAEPDQKCIFYFKGCDPRKDPDFYDEARHKFGGDDFGEYLPLNDLQAMIDNPKATKLRITLTATQMRIETFI